jgi:hypothetical protein
MQEGEREGDPGCGGDGGGGVRASDSPVAKRCSFVLFFLLHGLVRKKKFSVKLLRLVVDRGHGQQDKDRHTESSFMNPDFRRYGVSAS